jgi:hypothetical protein
MQACPGMDAPQMQARQGGPVVIKIEPGINSKEPDRVSNVPGVPGTTMAAMLARKTRAGKEKDAYILQLEQEQDAHAKEKRGMVRENANLQAYVSSMEEELQAARDLTRALEAAKGTAEQLATMLRAERAHKRQRWTAGDAMAPGDSSL